MPDEVLSQADAERVLAARSDPRRVPRWNELLRRAAADEGVAVLPYDQLYCGVPIARQPDRPDGVHLSPKGARTVWHWLLPQLEQAGPTTPG
jgi:lysophospholipase L1-like esterase